MSKRHLLVALSLLYFSIINASPTSSPTESIDDRYSSYNPNPADIGPPSSIYTHTTQNKYPPKAGTGTQSNSRARSKASSSKKKPGLLERAAKKAVEASTGRKIDTEREKARKKREQKEPLNAQALATLNQAHLARYLAELDQNTQEIPNITTPNTQEVSEAPQQSLEIPILTKAKHGSEKPNQSRYNYYGGPSITTAPNTQEVSEAPQQSLKTQKPISKKAKHGSKKPNQSHYSYYGGPIISTGILYPLHPQILLDVSLNSMLPMVGVPSSMIQSSLWAPSDMWKRNIIWVQVGLRFKLFQFLLC